MITFQNINKKFKPDFWAKEFHALSDINFTIEEGKITGFLGANGAGKTTSINILMKFIKSTSGEVLFDKRLGKNTREIFSSIGYVPERPYLPPYLKGDEFLNYMGALNNIKKSKLNEMKKKWTERLLIDHALSKNIRSFSKGMLQRLCFVSSLIHDPKLLILDEPLSGLDPVGRQDIKDVLLELNKEGKTIFFSSHIVSDVEEVSSDVVVLQKGKLLYNGLVNKLIKENIKPYIYIKARHSSGFKSLIKNEVLYSDRDDNFFHYKLDIDNRNSFIKELIDIDADILSVNQDKPTLERIIYKIED
jgi:ABC-2 type transport system ATP-binding protein